MFKPRCTADWWKTGMVVFKEHKQNAYTTLWKDLQGLAENLNQDS